MAGPRTRGIRHLPPERESLPGGLNRDRRVGDLIRGQNVAELCLLLRYALLYVTRFSPV